MAEQSDQNRRTRIRKSAPTVRERVEAAKEKAEQPKNRRAGRLLRRLAGPLRRLKLRERRIIKAAAVPLRFIKKILRWLVPRYFVNSWRELRQVQWPSRRETWRLTLAVFVFAIVFGALVAGVDKGLDELFKKVILK